MVEFLVLVNQIICKFKSSASTVLEEIFPTIASHLSVILSQDAFSAGPASNTEVILIASVPRCMILYFWVGCSCSTLMYLPVYIVRMLLPLECARLGYVLHYLLLFLFSYLWGSNSSYNSCQIQFNKANSSCTIYQYSLNEPRWHDTILHFTLYG